MPIYKVSYVVPDHPHAGTILSQEHPPKVGDKVVLHGHVYRITEVIELLPSKGLIYFMHATVEPAEDAQP